MSIQFLTTVCWVLALSVHQVAVAGESQTVTDERKSTHWLRVQSLSPGVQVQVRQSDKTTVKGRFVSAGENTLTIKAKSGELRIERSRIQKIHARRAAARLKGGAIGAAIGATSGIVIAVALGGALTDGDGVSSEAAAALGTLGAGIGFGLGLIPPGYTTIYKSH